MSNLEHIIENTLGFMEKSKKASYDDVIAHIVADSNYEMQCVDKSDIYEICVYFKETWCRSCKNNDVGWISCAEREPDKTGQYLCKIHKVNAKITADYLSIETWRETHWTTDGVTHWRPLPEPPKV